VMVPPGASCEVWGIADTRLMSGATWTDSDSATESFSGCGDIGRERRGSGH